PAAPHTPEGRPAPGPAPEADTGTDTDISAGTAAAPLVVWNLSAPTETGLRGQARRLAAGLRDGAEAEPYAVGHALATTRATFDHRAALVGRSAEELRTALESVAAGRSGAAAPVGRARAGKSAVVFAGQGSQRAGVGRELYAASPVFAAGFDEACAAFDGLLDRPLRELVLGAGADDDTLARTRYAQPAIFAVEVALYRLLESTGVRPGAVAGHSVGELVAAYVAGVWSLPDAARLVAARGRLMQSAPEGGAMVSLRATEDEVRDSLERLDVTAAVAVAAVNAPQQTVVSGDADQVRKVAEHWRAQGRRATRLRVSHAFHCAHMDGVLEEFRRIAASVTWHQPCLPVVSGSTGRIASAGDLTDPDHWTGQIRRTVRFADAVRHLHQAGVTTFLEVAGHPAVAQQIEETLDGTDDADGRTAPVVVTVTPEPERLLTALARAHVTGCDIDWRAWFTRPPRTPVDLPTYPFEHRPYWLAPAPAGGDAGRLGLTGTDGHPLLGALVLPAEGEGILLSGLLSAHTQPWLADHVIAGTPLLPGTAFLELALQACRAAGCDEVAELTLERPLALPAQGAVQIQVVVQGADAHGRRALAVHSRPARGQQPDDPYDEPWTCHATGALGPVTATAPEAAGAPRSAEPSAWLPADAVPLDLDDAYPSLARDGYAYGPAFQGLRAAWSAGPDLYAEVETAQPQHADAARFGLHPVLLDAALHVLAIAGLHDGRTQVPFSFTGVRLHAHGATTLRARLRRSDGTVSLTLTDPAGEAVADVAALTLRALGPRVAAAGPPLHVVRWTPLGAQPPTTDTSAVPVPTVVQVAEAGPECLVDVHHETARVLAAVHARLDGDDDGTLVVVAPSSDLVGAAVGGLVRSVQAEHPGRFVLVETDAPGARVPAELLSTVVASGEPYVRLQEDTLLVPRLTRLVEPSSPAGSSGPRPTEP
ncbi:acyltransferase domain-containing protein, partial [Streptomyces odontomachi]|uniref:acyltransferase domain-containing protein n=1 Tax=Streptomyces odontomachi TaxID=2944940 RepID=UPI00210A45CA